MIVVCDITVYVTRFQVSSPVLMYYVNRYIAHYVCVIFKLSELTLLLTFIRKIIQQTSHSNPCVQLAPILCIGRAGVKKLQCITAASAYTI